MTYSWPYYPYEVKPGRYLITAPTEEVVTLAEAKAILRITSSDQDAAIQQMINAAVSAIDPAGGGWLGRALRPQTWELRMPYFCGEIELPYPPLISVDSVKHYDGDGVDTTLTEGTDYRVYGVGHMSKSKVVTPYQSGWPSSVRVDHESIRVQFTAGYSAGPPDRMPPVIKQAVLLGVREIYSVAEKNLYLRSEVVPGVAEYEWTVSDNAGAVINAAVENYLATQRVIE
jgi:uncharacterized phiE125 gp8 family phage protein